MKTRFTNLAQFVALSSDEKLVLKGKGNGSPRVAAFDVSTSGPVCLFTVNEDTGELAFLVKVDGYQTIEMTIVETTTLLFGHEENDYVNVRLHGAAQRIAKTSGEKYTSLDRRPARNSDLDRMMALMNHNFNELRINQEQETNRKIAQAERRAERRAEAKLKKEPENVATPTNEATKEKTDADKSRKKGPKPSGTTDSDGTDATKPVAGSES